MQGITTQLAVFPSFCMRVCMHRGGQTTRSPMMAFVTVENGKKKKTILNTAVKNDHRYLASFAKIKIKAGKLFHIAHRTQNDKASFLLITR